MESTLEAIVVEDNEELLKSIESDLSVEDGEITSQGNSVPIMKYATEKSSLKCVGVFLETGVKLSESRTKLLAKAIKNGDPRLVEYLVDPALIHETTEEDGRSPLHIAAEFGNKEVFQLLLSHMVGHDQVDKVDKYGNTALHLCARSQNKEAIECMKMLLDKEANIELKNSEGLSPLHIAASGKNISNIYFFLNNKNFISEGRRENADFLISRNAQLNSRDNQKKSVIQTIAMKVPHSMEEFKNHLERGIVLENSDLSQSSSINLDFTKLMDKKKFTEDTNDMTLFSDLVKTSFKDYVEHPLCHAFLYLKYCQVKWFYFIIVMALHLIFSVVFSIYSGLMFVVLCAPNENSNSDDRWLWNKKIDCQISPNPHTVNATFTAWMFLMLSAIPYILREIAKFVPDKKSYFQHWHAYRNIFTIVSIFLTCHQGHLLVMQKEKIQLHRWQYHVASICCLLLWVEMMFLVGKLPRFGKHVQMFK